MRTPISAGRSLGISVRAGRHLLLDEAVAVARFFDTYFVTVRNQDGSVARIGLDSVAREGRELTASTGAEVLSLRDAIHEAQARYVAASAPREGPPLARADGDAQGTPEHHAAKRTSTSRSKQKPA